MTSAPNAVGLHWDDGEPAIYFRRDRVRPPRAETPALTPSALQALPRPLLRYADLEPAADLVSLFRKLDNVLHQAGHIREDRHTILLKLLLVKLFDEENSRADRTTMLIQDFSTVPEEQNDPVEKLLTDTLQRALTAYDGVLAKTTPASIGCSGTVLREISQVLCPFRILGASPQVIQDFFMYFGRFHYRVDLGQYFTPYEVIRLIVEIINPRPGEHIVDPACGTADFLVGAKQVAEERHKLNIARELHGCDIAPLAVHLSIFNMLLNGDHGYADIQVTDTMAQPLERAGRYDIALCNPPFGARILEKRRNVLQRFELVTRRRAGRGFTLKSQEVGLLYVEACLKAVRPGGRVGIIVPNGYLGNRSERYLTFRQWLLRNARIVAVIGFPRFTFKKSGADVSASALVLERRLEPLADLEAMEDYPVHVNLVERVGWDLQSKYASRIFKRDPRDGTEILDAHGAKIPDADFDDVRIEALTSEIVEAFPWTAAGVPEARKGAGWSIRAADIIARPDLSLDPKRWCRKYRSVLESVRSVPHLKIGAVLRPVTRLLRRRPEAVYRYVEIEKIYEFFGAYVADEYYGWSLPERGRQIAAPGDLFIANIWSSAGKWLIAGDEARDQHLIVTNGCSHFELIPGQEALLPDLVFGLCSEAFKVQMRALATGSDGLSSVSVADLCTILLPRMKSAKVRKKIERRISEARAGHLILPRLVRDELALIAPQTDIPRRTSHVLQV